MATVRQLTRILDQRPRVGAITQIAIRNYRGDQDIAAFLRLRERAFARQALGIRQWSEADFQAEFTWKPWWQPERMWFAETDDRLAEPTREVGTVTLAMRRTGEIARPVVHWLAVLPACAGRESVAY